MSSSTEAVLAQSARQSRAAYSQGVLDLFRSPRAKALRRVFGTEQRQTAAMVLQTWMSLVRDEHILFMPSVPFQPQAIARNRDGVRLYGQKLLAM